MAAIREMPLENPRRSKRLRRTRTETNILDLPDELLGLIMQHMNVGDSSGTFQEPRHAFFLAITNTRMLAVFREMIKRITPDLSNATPATLSSRHILAVSRLAGEHLREVHFTECFDNTLKDISLACPRLELLSFHDKPRLRRAGLKRILGFTRFRGLSVTDPTPALLRNLRPTPKELTLVNVDRSGARYLGNILKRPPQELVLSLKYSPTGDEAPSWLLALVDVLAEAVPRIGAVNVFPSDQEGSVDQGFAQVAPRLINKVRHNSADSICMSINVTAWEFFTLLKGVHPRAVIEVSDGRETFVGPGPPNQFYATRVVLDEHYTPHNVHLLQEVSVLESRTAPWESWKELFAKVMLRSAFVIDVRPAKLLELNAHTIELPISSIKRNRQWAWLGDAMEINLIGEDRALFGEQELNLFRGISSILRFFRGSILWISDLKPECFTKNCGDVKVHRALKSLIRAVNAFERDDGDAGTVQTMIDSALKRWSLKRSDL